MISFCVSDYKEKAINFTGFFKYKGSQGCAHFCLADRSKIATIHSLIIYLKLFHEVGGKNQKYQVYSLEMIMRRGIIFLKTFKQHIYLQEQFIKFI